MDDEKQDDFTLSEESIRVLREHRRQLDEDIATGRFKPGDRRCVPLPNGDRFYIAHPQSANEATERAQRLSWWRRLLRIR